jgi:hypothetical protein
MKIRVFCIGLFLVTLIIANCAFAETVVFARRYVVDRSNIIVDFNAVQEKIHVSLAFASGMAAVEIKFSSEDKWDWEKVHNASKAVARYINKNSDIDPFKMLTEAGLTGLKLKAK